MTNLSQVIPELAPLPQGNDKQDTKPYVSVNWGYGPGKPVVIARGINKQVSPRSRLLPLSPL